MRNCPKCGKPFADEVQFCPNDGSALSAVQQTGDPLIGTLMDNYRIEAKLGEGGMGMVYKAEHTLIGRSVALKVLHPDLARNAEAVDRFFREARAANEVPSDHIVEVTDMGKNASGHNYLVMELLAGESMQDLLVKTGALEPLRAARLALQIAEGLAAAHEKGVIHRDLKPANIQLVARGAEPEFVKLLDFGIAKISESDTQLTKTGVILGSPAYMSPEQASGSKIDHRTDIYALGVILYEMVAGQPPFVGQSPTQVLLAHVSQQPAPPRDMVPDVPLDLEALILACLAKDPAKRPQSMEQVMAQLRAWMGSVSAGGAAGAQPSPGAAFAATALGPGLDSTLPPGAPSAQDGAMGTAQTMAAVTGPMPQPAVGVAPGPVPLSSLAAVSAPVLIPPTQAAGTGQASQPVAPAPVLIPPTQILAAQSPPTQHPQTQNPPVQSVGTGQVPLSGAANAPAPSPLTPPTASVPPMATPSLAEATAGVGITTQTTRKPDPGLVKGIIIGGVLVAAVSAGFFIFRSGDKTPDGQREMEPVATQAPPPAEHKQQAASPGAGEPPPAAQPGKDPPAATPPETAAAKQVPTASAPVSRPPQPAPRAPRRPPPSQEPAQQPVAATPSTPKEASSSRPQVTVQSSPSGAQIFGGGRQLGTTPRKFYSDKGFTLMLKQQGYQPAYLTVKPDHRGVLTTKLVPLPEYQRTNSLERLKQLYRARQMSRRQWKARIKTLMAQRDRRIRAIKEAYKRGQFSRSARNQRINAVKEHYR